VGIRQVSAVLSQLIVHIPNIIAALTQLGIAVQLTAPKFLIVVRSVALAASIAFGWGARNGAQDIVERAYDRRDEARPEESGGGSAKNPGDGAPGAMAQDTVKADRAPRVRDPVQSVGVDEKRRDLVCVWTVRSVM